MSRSPIKYHTRAHVCLTPSRFRAVPKRAATTTWNVLGGLGGQGQRIMHRWARNLRCELLANPLRYPSAFAFGRMGGGAPAKAFGDAVARLSSISPVTAFGDFGSRYGKTKPANYFARGVAEGVAVNSPRPAKTSSKTRLQLRTVSVNTYVCLPPSSRRLTAHARFLSSSPEDFPTHRDSTTNEIRHRPVG